MKGDVVNNNAVYEWILRSTFTASARKKSLETPIRHFSPLVQELQPLQSTPRLVKVFRLF
jgi:hypothetical protein